MDFGIFELYEDAGEELARRIDYARSEVIKSAATPAEQARLADIEEVLAQWGPVIQGDVRRARAAYLLEEWGSIVEGAIRRAGKAGEALAAAQAAERQLRELWEHDKAAYRGAYEAAVRQVLAERGIVVVANELADVVHFVDALSDEAADVGEGWKTLDPSIHARVVQVAPLPMTGQAPPDWRDGMPAEGLRKAGLTYLERATASPPPQAHTPLAPEENTQL